MTFSWLNLNSPRNRDAAALLCKEWLLFFVPLAVCGAERVAVSSETSLVYQRVSMTLWAVYAEGWGVGGWGVAGIPQLASFGETALSDSPDSSRLCHSCAECILLSPLLCLYCLVPPFRGKGAGRCKYRSYQWFPLSTLG